MLYKVGMLCKHFKGKDLYEKNIYRIEALNVLGKDIDQSKITYTGDGNLLTAKNLVVYSSIFQDNKTFAREYDDISAPMSEEKQNLYGQTSRVEPLTEEEIKTVNDSIFIKKKKEYVLKKYGK